MKRLITNILAITLVCTSLILNAQPLSTSFTTIDNSTCNYDVPDCPCDGKMRSLTVVYQGAGGVTVNVYDDKDLKSGDLITSFSNVQSGDIITVNASGLSGGDFESNTYFHIAGSNSKTKVEIHTSCSREIIGNTYGPYTVIGYTDGEGNVCEMNVCNGSVNLTVSGGSSPYSYYWSNGFTSQDISSVCPGNYSVTVRDASGTGVIQAVTVNQAPSDIEVSLTATPDNSCGSDIPEPCNCECDGKMRSITVEYNGPAGATVTVTEKDNMDGVVYATFNNVQPGQELTVNATANGGQFESKTFFYVNGGSEVEIHTSCSQDVGGQTFGAFTVVSFVDGAGNTCQTENCIGPCECDGKMRNITVVYEGQSGATVTVTEDDNSGGVQYATFSNVQNGEVLYVEATANGGQFESETYFNIVGGSETSIHTSCSRDVLGNTYGAFTVIGYTDGDRNECNAGCTGTGSVTLTVIDGEAPFTFRWSNGATSQNLEGVCDGSYTVTVTDASGCSIINTVTVVDAPSGISAVSETTPDASCEPACVGHIQCFVNPDEPEASAQTTWDIDQNAGTVTIRATLAKTFVDNTYGTNTVGWSGGHSFGNLTGSDKLELSLFDANGVKQMEFTIDYMSSSGSAPSGYASLGVTGGEGGISQGNLSNILNATTSLSVNFNTFGYVLTTNSPATNANYTPNPTYPNWIYEVWYEATVDLSVFGAAGFGYPEITDLHASPKKTGSSDVEPAPCPDEFCTDNCTGTIDLTVTAGEGPFTFVWSNGKTTEDLLNACDGIYTVTITDANGCTFEHSDTVGQIPSTLTSSTGSTADENCRPIQTGPCDCDGKMRSITVQYNGPSGASINVYNKSGHDVLVGSFSNVQSGAILTVNATANGGQFESNTYFDVVGGQEISIHTSCSKDVLNKTYGNFTVMGYTDGDGNQCNPTICTGTLHAEGANGAPPYTYVWSNGIASADQTNICTGKYYVTVTDAAGCFVVDSAEVVPDSSGIEIIYEKINTLCEGDSIYTPIPCNCDCDGKMREISLQYNGPNNATVNVYNKSDHDVLIASFSNVQSGDIIAASASGYKNGQFESNTFFVINGGNNLEIHTSCSKDVLGLTFGDMAQGSLTVVGFVDGENNSCAPPPTGCPAPCPCDGKMREITLVYNGNSGTTVNAWTDGTGSTLLGSFNNVQTGQVITFNASANGGQFKSNTYFEVVGQSETTIHTSCSRDVQGKTFGPLTVVGYTDGDGNVCDLAPICIGAGSINLSVSGGTPPYTYHWSNGSMMEDQNSLCGGMYHVTVTDAGGCTAVEWITIEDSVGIDVTSETTVNRSCAPDTTTVPCTGVTLLKWDSNPCTADDPFWSGFSPSYPSEGGCSSVWGSDLYRNQGGNSCSPGHPGGDGLGFCSGSFGNANWTSDDPEAIRFDVSFGAGDAGHLTALKFWELATTPAVFSNGNTVDNDYPTLYGIRVLKDGVEIYLSINNPTSQNWSLEEFDFTGDPDFNYDGPTTFQFELLAYSPVGNGKGNKIWDLDDISVDGCCGSSEACIGTGTADITVSGGTAPYTYAWSNGKTTEDIDQLCGGMYCVTITDAHGCFVEECVTIEDTDTIPPCSIEGPDPICPGSSATYSGDPGADSYSWSISGNGSISGPADQVDVTVVAGNICGFFVLSLESEYGECVTECSDTFYVSDTIAPEFTLVGESDTIQCPAIPEFTPPTVTDNCDTSVTVTMETDSIPGECAQGYTLVRTWTATDDCGNTATASQSITVTDNTAPVLTGVGPDTTVTCIGLGLFDDPTATDLCDDDVAITFEDDTTSDGCPFIITRIFTATDGCGNSTTATQTISIIDTSAPAITTAPNDTIECPGSPTFTPPTVADDCDPNPTVTFEDDTIPGACPQEYTITRTWTATDNCNNSSTASQSIAVEDNTPPLLVCGANLTVQCPNIPEFANPFVDDLCDPEPVLTFTDDTIPGICPVLFTISRKWLATDACGNADSVTQSLIVVDNNPPVLIGVGSDKTIQCPATPQFPNPTAYDLCDPLVDIDFTTDTLPGVCADEYTLTRTWIATDDCGNTDTASMSIMVIDTVPPTITCPPDVVLQCNESTSPDSTGFASCDDNCSSSQTTYTDSVVSGASPGAGPSICINAGNGQFIAASGDTFKADQLYSGGAAYTAAIAIANTSDDKIYQSERYNSSFSYDFPVANGNYIVELHFAEIYFGLPGGGSGGGVGSRVFDVTVEGNLTLDNYDIIAQAGAPATAIVEVVAVNVADNNLDIDFAGVTNNAKVSAICVRPQAVQNGCDFHIARTWTCTDDCGNSASCVQHIWVLDTIPPVVSCPADTTIQCGESTDPENTGYATCEDNCDFEPTPSYTDVILPGECPQAYEIQRSWVCMDVCGNADTCVQIITVVDTVPPTVNCPADTTISCLASTDPGSTGFATCEDNCDTLDNTPSWVDSIATGTCPQEYDIYRTWTCTDDCGNSSSCTQVISVVDDNLPYFTELPEDDTIPCTDPVVFDTPLAADSCGTAAVVVLGTDTLADLCPEVYVYTRTWIAVDACGNQSADTASQSITVLNPHDPPVSTNVLCYDTCDGTASIAGACYEYFWNVESADSMITGLCAGTYYVTLTDQYGCQAVDSVEVEQPDSIDLEIIKTDVTCDCAPVNTPDQFCQVSFENFQHGEYLDGQFGPVGIHISGVSNGPIDTLIIFDTAEDSTADPDLEVNIGKIAILPQNVIDANNDGLVDSPNDYSDGGMQIYRFDFPVDVVSFTYVDNDKHLGSATAYDVNDSVIATAVIPVTPDGGVVTIDLNAHNVRRLVIQYDGSGGLKLLTLCETPDTCCNGTASVSPSGGTPPYNYLWSTGETTSSIDSLCPGMYHLTVTDDNNCEKIEWVTINQQEGDTTIVVNQEICEGDSFFVGGAYQTVSDTYYDTLPGSVCLTILQTNLTVLENAENFDSTAICEGDSIFLGGVYQTAPGIYIDIFDAANGCDSLLYTTLTILPEDTTYISDTICFSDRVFVQPTSTQVFIGSNGCDSVVITQTVVLPIDTTLREASICTGDSIFLGGAYQTIADDYMDIYTGSDACDSLVITTLTVEESIVVIADTAICDGDSILLGGEYQSSADVFIDTFDASGGCDSIRITTLTILPTNVTNLTEEVCQATPPSVDFYTNQYGCDSIVITTYIVTDAIEVDLDTAICAGDSILLGGEYYTTAGVFVDSFTASTGCDSIVTTTLTLLPTDTTEITVYVCEPGDPFTEVFTNTSGCDSVVITTYLQDEPSVDTADTLICFGDSVFLEGSWQTASGIFTDTYEGANGCDSIVITTLTVNPPIELETETTDVSCVCQPPNNENQFCQLSFDDFVHGQYLDGQFGPLGIHIQGISNGPIDTLIIFDTAEDSTADPDLEVNIGKIAILPQNVTDANNDGIVDSPNDYSSGGKQIYTFDFPVDIVSFTYVDNDAHLGSATVYDGSNSVIASAIIPVTADGGVVTVDLNVTGARRLEIEYDGSGGLKLLTLCETPDTCCDGTASVTPSGGTPPFTYLWSTGATTSSIDSLCPGMYHVTVTDSNLCSEEAWVSVNLADSCGAPCDNIVCDDQNPCTDDICLNGICIYTPFNCDDENPCTIDTCIAGTCVNIPIEDCVGGSCEGVDCNDNDLCTIDTCINGVCFNTPVVCDDGDLCTTDTCINGQCFYIPTLCEDGDLCTLDTCINGQCVFLPIVCNDGDPCTIDECINGVCSFSTSVIDLEVTGSGLSSCEDCDGSVSVNATGGTAPYSYLWSTGDTTQTVSGGGQAGSGGICINTGNGYYIASTGDTFTNDQLYAAGATYTNSIAIANTTDDLLYQSERYNGLFSYNVPVDNGSYIVELHFAEIYFGTPGKPAGGIGTRVFDVSVEGVLELDNYDIIAAAGAPATAVVETINTTVADGILNIVFNAEVQNAKVSAICIRPVVPVSGLCAGNYTVTVTDVNGCSAVDSVSLVPENCDDGDPCTINACVNGACTFIPVNCDDGNPCTVDACINGACSNIPVNCNDGDPCTVDQCVAGICSNVPVNCDDGDSCTTDICINGTCLNIPVIDCGNPCLNVNCDDGNPCTVDSCNNGQCYNVPIVCDDGDPCTSDFCLNGTCVFVDIPGCANPCDTIVCTDGNPCTIDTCINGQCSFVPVICDDGDPCTIDLCANGACVFVDIPGCANPCDTLVCNDGNPCTTDTCINGQCVYVPITCDDGDPCTVDNCIAGQCVYTPIPPVTAVKQVEICQGECYFAEGACQTKPGFYYDTLTASNGCDSICITHLYILPNKFSADWIMLCEGDSVFVGGAWQTEEGVYYDTLTAANGCDSILVRDILVIPNTFGARTITICAGDSVFVGGDWQTAGGAYYDTLVNVHGCDSILLTELSIDENCEGCPLAINGLTLVYEGVAGDIGPLSNGDTIDFCVFSIRADACLDTVASVRFQLTGPSPIDRIENIPPFALNGDNPPGNYKAYAPLPGNYTLVVTPYNAAGASGVAGPAAVVNFTVTGCDDGDPCTLDGCINGVCTHTPIPGCGVDLCAGVDCDDNDLCTIDVCVNGVCSNTAINCNDNDPCTVDECVNGVCSNIPVDCNDDNPCTIDVCSGGTCFNTIIPGCGDLCDGVNCDDNDPCTIDTCINGICSNTSVNCDDGDPCTIDLCTGGICLNVEIPGCNNNPCTTVNCDDNDPCTVDTCINGQCFNTPMVCTDGDECTIDTCIGGQCVFLPITDCEDLCADIVCNDGDPCTIDTCISGQCFYEDVSCDDGNACTVDIMQADNSCVHIPVTTTPAYLEVINLQTSWRKLKLGYGPTSIWSPKVDVTAGGNDTVCITLRDALGTVDWSKIQFRPQGDPGSAVSLGNYVPECIGTDWVEICLPLSLFPTRDFTRLTFLEIPYSDGAGAFEIDLMRIEFVGGTTPLLWFGGSHTNNYHDGQSGSGSALLAQLIEGVPCNGAAKLAQGDPQDQLSSEVSDLKVYPIPFDNMLKLDFTTSNEGPMTIRVIDILGQIVKVEKVEAIAGDNQFTLELSPSLSSGLYVLEVEKENYIEYVKLSKSR